MSNIYNVPDILIHLSIFLSLPLSSPFPPAPRKCCWLLQSACWIADLFFSARREAWLVSALLVSSLRVQAVQRIIIHAAGLLKSIHTILTETPETDSLQCDEFTSSRKKQNNNKNDTRLLFSYSGLRDIKTPLILYLIL